ncbi:triose-phosphate transporter family-domain-containing protein [Chaetomidium leptoderma]|uniref:Triose-phosphate transporter family-domain-containing protein n=1 Tax=Chaetomidium leptoderma TaxID=669021 RepID=A0AAN6VHC9_9PEZI|nr:triose-phosphate transporter family-domain-containing protein [Chaetomidium leptoderma]
MAEDDVERQVEKPRPAERPVHAIFYIASWIFFSNLTILFNKWIIDNRGFTVIITCWHLIFATFATQILARTTKLLDGRHTVKMTGRTYLRAIVPIGLLYSASLVCSNMVYLYLSVAFIQMLKSAAPVAVLLTSWAWGVEDPSLRRFLNILLIVAGVALASYGEIDFSMAGFLFQIGGIVFEAMRLVMIQVLLSGDTQKMDPLVSLYYYAPVCAVMNVIIAIGSEANTFNPADLAKAGYGLLLLNAMVAFMLNVSSVFLIGKTSGLVMCLTGILKNILLVIISVMIWHTNISGIQFLGYGIALAGLVYYSLGWDQLVLLSQGVWVYVKGGYESVRGGLPGGGGAATTGDDHQQQQQHGRLPVAVRRALIMGVAAFILMVLAGGFFYSSGQAAAIDGGEQLASGGAVTA